MRQCEPFRSSQNGTSVAMSTFLGVTSTGSSLRHHHPQPARWRNSVFAGPFLPDLFLSGPRLTVTPQSNVASALRQTRPSFSNIPHLDV